MLKALTIFAIMFTIAATFACGRDPNSSQVAAIHSVELKPEPLDYDPSTKVQAFETTDLGLLNSMAQTNSSAVRLRLTFEAPYPYGKLLYVAIGRRVWQINEPVTVGKHSYEAVYQDRDEQWGFPWSEDETKALVAVKMGEYVQTISPTVIMQDVRLTVELAGGASK